MTVDLSQYYELDIDGEILDFSSEIYCANCNSFEMRDDPAIQKSMGTPYCVFWDEETEVKSGLICAEYVPQGYE